jgi:hypothetical protein
LAEFLSQLREFIRQPVSSLPFFRSVRLRQAALPSSDSTSLLQGPFAPRAITPLPRYYEPLRHPLGRSRLLIPASRWLFTTQEGFPGSSTDLSSRAAPNHPGDPDRCLLVSSRPMAGFILFGGLARSRLSNEAESGSLALRLTSPPARGFNASGCPSRCSPASCCTSNYMVNSFRPLDLPVLSWRTERQRAVPHT